MKLQLIKQYSRAKLSIPKKRVKGREVANVDAGARWYVYFRYRNPISQKLELKKYKKGLNLYKTAKERKYHGKILVTALNHLLDDGWSPFDDTNGNKNQTSFLTITDAINYALDAKKNSWKSSTYKEYSINAGVFIKWLVKERKDQVDIKQFDFSDALLYMAYLRNRNISVTTIHNYRRGLRTIFNILKKDRIITENHFEAIDTKSGKEKMHRPFTSAQIQTIRDYLFKNDMQLYYFINIMMYSFLRNQEVLKLKVRDIDLINDIISVETKVEKLTRKLLHKNLKKILINEFKLKNRPLDDFIITPELATTGDWNVNINTKKRYFSDKFMKVRKELNLSNEYTIYSFRHTFISNIYLNLLETDISENEAINQLMGITGHYSEKALRKYLRNIGAALPKSYDNLTSIDF